MGATVVVADDDKTIRSILQHKLSAEGYDLHVCEDGEEARELLDSEPVVPDLVLLDVMMPRLEGTQLLRMIRRGELDLPSDVPVVMLTSRGREEDVLEGLESGADEYVTKPFSPSEVLFRVKKHLGDS
jgi:DNA-binding response OmpR family regulator